MSILLDTNILLRISEPDHPHYSAAATSVNRLLSSGELLHIVPQNIYEFWAVATRPLGENGLGMSTRDAQKKADELVMALHLLPDLDGLYQRWRELVVAFDCKGKTAHDARIAAAMSLHGIIRILTFNIRDFTRFKNLTVLDPQQIAAAP